MTTSSLSRRPLNVLIAGGGVAGLEAMLALRQLAAERVSIELIAPEPQFWYRPLAVAEPFGSGRVHGLDLSDVANECGALFTLGELAAVDAKRRVAVTSAGVELRYDALLIAAGVQPLPSLPGAFTFRGPADADAFAALLAELDDGGAHRVVFALAGGTAWPLPLYELALQTAGRLPAVEIHIVTHEEAPLELFGAAASTAVAGRLAERGIELRTSTYPVAFEDGALALKPRGQIEADYVVAMPRLQPPTIESVPTDAKGFVLTDDHGRVRGLEDVFAAGDITAFPVKQGGLAAQQADAAAEAIAALAGAELEPQPFRPVLRSLILTGGTPLFARSEPGRAGDEPVVDEEPLWWPPGKIVGRYLAPFLAERASLLPSEYEKLPG